MFLVHHSLSLCPHITTSAKPGQKNLRTQKVQRCTIMKLGIPSWTELYRSSAIMPQLQNLNPPLCCSNEKTQHRIDTPLEVVENGEDAHRQFHSVCQYHSFSIPKPFETGLLESFFHASQIQPKQAYASRNHITTHITNTLLKTS